MSTTLPLVALDQERATVRQQLFDLEADYLQRRDAYRRELARLDAKAAMVAANLDVDRIQRALDVINIRGEAWAGPAHDPVNRDRLRVVDDAIADLAAGAPRLRNVYFGTKDYDRFVDQRCDCDYGYGPKHGWIVFSVGLCRRHRQPTWEQIEDALYLLHAFEHGTIKAADLDRLREPANER